MAKYNVPKDLEKLLVSIDEPKQDDRNARKNHNVDGIAGSLEKYGQRRPIVVNKRTGIIEANNGVHKAAKSLGWTHIAVVFVDDDPVTATGFSIADNRLGDQSVFDQEVLVGLFDEIPDPLDIPGVDENFVNATMADLIIMDDVSSQLSSSAEPNNQRFLGDKQKQIKVVLYADDLADFEKAIRLTGLKNRGQAILEICRTYIDEKGQFDISPESLPEIESIGELP